MLLGTDRIHSVRPESPSAPHLAPQHPAFLAFAPQPALHPPHLLVDMLPPHFLLTQARHIVPQPLTAAADTIASARVLLRDAESVLILALLHSCARSPMLRVAGPGGPE